MDGSYGNLKRLATVILTSMVTWYFLYQNIWFHGFLDELTVRMLRPAGNFRHEPRLGMSHHEVYRWTVKSFLFQIIGFLLTNILIKATGTLLRLPGNNPVRPEGGTAIAYSDNVSPLIALVYAYTGSSPTATGQIVTGHGIRCTYNF